MGATVQRPFIFTSFVSPIMRQYNGGDDSGGVEVFQQCGGAAQN